MNHNKQQKATETANQETGLTPLQEQTAIMLASGERITAVAEQLNLNRSTIYKWQRLVTFKCFFNRQCKDYRDTLITGLFGLSQEALQTIKESLHSDNEAVRLKTAMWLADKINNITIGDFDVHKAIKEECTQNQWEWADNIFGQSDYEARLKELNLSDD